VDNLGKIPPQAIEAEESLLAAILVQPGIIDDIFGIIVPEMFYNSIHQTIYSNILEIYNKGKEPDLFTLTEQLRKNNELDNIGGPVYLAQIISKVVSSRYAIQHALIIKEKYIRREFIRIGTELRDKSFDDSGELGELIDFAEGSLYTITNESILQDPEQLSIINAETIKVIKKIEGQEIELIGVPSGITLLDRLTLGFQKSDLILIAGRPSMGKTAFSLFISREAAIQGYKILFFSLEMSKRQLSYRLLVDRFTDINELKLGKDIDWDSVNKQNGDYAQNIFVDDTPALRAMEIRSIARKFKKKVGIDMIIVDYLQLARGNDAYRKSGNKYAEVGDISKVFKSIAKELDIPVIAVSQLSRKVEDRSNPFPILSDLRESGELEQDADIVIFLTRFRRLPEKYWIDRKTGDDMRDKAYIDVAKNRQGKCDKILTTASEDAMFWNY